LIDNNLSIPNGIAPASFAKAELEKRWDADGFEWVAAYSVSSPATLFLCSEQKQALSGISPTVAHLLESQSSALHHNHPSSDPLSPGDYKSFQTFPLLQEIYAYGHDRLSWYCVSVSRPLSVEPVGDSPEESIDNFLTAIDAPRDTGRIAFREGYAAAVVRLTAGRYSNHPPASYVAAYKTDKRLPIIETCSKLVTEACYGMAASSLLSASKAPIIDIFTCIDGALSKGQYDIPVWQQPTTIPTDLTEVYENHCRTLADWITQTFP
jgi:hypothetical protein